MLKYKNVRDKYDIPINSYVFFFFFIYSFVIFDIKEIDIQYTPLKTNKKSCNASFNCLPNWEGFYEVLQRYLIQVVSIFRGL